MRIWLINAALFLILLACLFWPVCVPLTAEQLESYRQQTTIPIEQRTDRDFFVRVFQFRDGRWCQCKTRLGRMFFF